MWTMVIYLTAINILVLSRGGLIPFFLISSFFYVRKLYISDFKSLALITSGAVAGIILLVTLFYMPNFRPRFDSMLINVEKSLAGDNNESVSLHLKSWYCAIQLASDYHLWTGYGTGDEGISLAHCYEDNHWRNMTFNAHNEYLSNLVRHGLTGLIIFSATLFWPLWISYQKREFLYLTFLLLFSMALMTVSLSLQHGVVFYSLFNALLFKRMMGESRGPNDESTPFTTN